METTFDFVVIGAGSSGCALAGRLAASGDDSVAIIEAGGSDDHALVTTPAAGALMLPRAGRRNYGYLTAPQPGLDGRRGYQPRGRGLGGSSSLNAMIYTRGTPGDYDGWASGGCDGWSWDDVLPVFRRSECNERVAGRDDDPLHGGTGPLHVSDLRSPNAFARHFIEAAVQAGLPPNRDFNGEVQEGVGWYQVTQRAGERWNAARAYLRGDGTLAPDNLHVLTGMRVLRVLFARRRATGVLVWRDGREQVIHARREVILSAGTIGSPQLLMVSGVGPAPHLREHGMALVHELPGVGANLQDHLDIALHKRLPAQARAPALFGLSLAGALRLLREIARYRRARTGMLTSNFAEAGGFVKSRPDLDEPDLQLHFVVGMADDHLRTLHRGHGYSCHVCVLRPRSRGMVRLASADPRRAPRIDPGYLSDPADLDDMVAGLRVVRRIFAQPALAAFGGETLCPGHLRDGIERDDTEALRALVRARADTIYHPVGTCRMGVDAGAVVDPQLRVRGVQGLRVVDASIMPTLIGGNTNAAAIMIGERAHDLIRYGPRVTLRLGEPALA
ncbi:GMC family oxidoreductase [Cupriavidus respiraculi]|uniref:Alcohol dehydrogenase [acceptor] n=1 Tax=Cupriavidus respiraculi TaxID=195930 RepID=A0ABN7YRE0_9BURK|nr:GMC family oxidoreductase N-terminal domain-containing protein [Cupriavidus respiraculi]CAG9175743.1 Alcohol dehydrogenase [acceptor] [Cupriavidus respiraculi]